MKRFHIAIGVHDMATAIADYSARLGENPCVVRDGKYALWRTDLLNFSISYRAELPAGTIRHIGFEDDTAKEFTHDVDHAVITWERFPSEAQAVEIENHYGTDKNN